MFEKVLSMNLMFKDQVTALLKLRISKDGDFHLSNIKIVNRELAPSWINNRDNLEIGEKWILSRYLGYSNIQVSNILLRKEMFMPYKQILSGSKEKSESLIYYGVSLNDYWWLKRKGGEEIWANLDPSSIEYLDISNTAEYQLITRLDGFDFRDRYKYKRNYHSMWILDDDNQWYTTELLSPQDLLSYLIVVRLADLLNLPVENVKQVNTQLHVYHIVDQTQRDQGKYFESLKFISPTENHDTLSFIKDLLDFIDYNDDVQFKESIYKLFLFDFITRDTIRSYNELGIIRTENSNSIQFAPISNFNHAFREEDSTEVQDFMISLISLYPGNFLDAFKVFHNSFNSLLLEQHIRDIYEHIDLLSNDILPPISYYLEFIHTRMDFLETIFNDIGFEDFSEVQGF